MNHRFENLAVALIFAVLAILVMLFEPGCGRPKPVVIPEVNDFHRAATETKPLSGNESSTTPAMREHFYSCVSQGGDIDDCYHWATTVYPGPSWPGPDVMLPIPIKEGKP